MIKFLGWIYVLQIFSHIRVCGLPLHFINTAFGRSEILNFDEIQFLQLLHT